MMILMQCSSTVAVISLDKDIVNKVYTVASSSDIQVEIDNPLDIIDTCKIIISDFDNLKNVKKYKEKVVVIKPPSNRLKDILQAGYRRFIFDIDNTDEIFVALCEEVDEVAIRGMVDCGPCKINFTTRDVSYNGKSIYLTRTDINYMRSRFVEKTDYWKSNSGRTTLYRMRRRIGSNFLLTERE